jgi:hypothetical protein
MKKEKGPVNSKGQALKGIVGLEGSNTCICPQE